MPCVGLDWFVPFFFASNRTGPVHFQTCIGFNRFDPEAALLYYVPDSTGLYWFFLCTGLAGPHVVGQVNQPGQPGLASLATRPSLAQPALPSQPSPTGLAGAAHEVLAIQMGPSLCIEILWKLMVFHVFFGISFREQLDLSLKKLDFLAEIHWEPCDDLGRSFGITPSPKFQNPTMLVNHFHTMFSNKKVEQ